MHQPSLTSRRALLKSIAAVLGTSALSPGLLAAVSSMVKPSVISALAINDIQRQTIHRCCDLIIPTTGTPGAVAAKVPEFIDTILTKYFSAEHATRFLQGIDLLGQMRGTDSPDSFLQSNPVRQLQWLTQVDRDTLVLNQQSPLNETYRDLKGLVILGYYTSEIGATQELFWDPVPGKYDGSLPYQQIGSASASTRS